MITWPEAVNELIIRILICHPQNQLRRMLIGSVHLHIFIELLAASEKTYQERSYQSSFRSGNLLPMST